MTFGKAYQEQMKEVKAKTALLEKDRFSVNAQGTTKCCGGTVRSNNRKKREGLICSICYRRVNVA